MKKKKINDCVSVDSNVEITRNAETSSAGVLNNAASRVTHNASLSTISDSRSNDIAEQNAARKLINDLKI